MGPGRITLSELAQPYFDSCAQGVLAAPRCRACGRFFFYPTVLCSHCHSRDWDWEATSGRGSVYSYTVVHRGLDSSVREPYIVAIVELEERIRLMSNLVNASVDGVRIGMAVRATFGESRDGRTVALFEPAPDGEAES